MESTSVTARDTARADTEAPRGGVFPYAVYAEIVQLLRDPLWPLLTIAFPIMFFSMFGLPYVGEALDGVSAGPYMMASFGTYGALSVALFSFGVSVASERGMGWNKLIRTTPLNPMLHFGAKTVMALLFGCVVLCVFFAYGALVGGVRMPLATWVILLGVLVAGMIPFVLLGLLLGYISSPNSAAAFAQVVFLPMGYASGLFQPLEFLPQIVQRSAPYLPMYHVAELGWTTVGAGDASPVWVHVAWLVGYSALFAVLALWAYRRDEGRNYA